MVDWFIADATLLFEVDFADDKIPLAPPQSISKSAISGLSSSGSSFFTTGW
jgi:hypothetical protein